MYIFKHASMFYSLLSEKKMQLTKRWRQQKHNNPYIQIGKHWANFQAQTSSWWHERLVCSNISSLDTLCMGGCCMEASDRCMKKKGRKKGGHVIKVCMRVILWAKQPGQDDTVSVVKWPEGFFGGGVSLEYKSAPSISSQVFVLSRSLREVRWWFVVVCFC